MPWSHQNRRNIGQITFNIIYLWKHTYMKNLEYYDIWIVIYNTGINILQYYNINITQSWEEAELYVTLTGCTAFTQSQFVWSCNQGNIPEIASKAFSLTWIVGKSCFNFFWYSVTCQWHKIKLYCLGTKFIII